MKTETSKLAQGKLAWDSLANITSMVILGVSGIIVNILIARYYSAGDLGVFNLSYAVYVIGSQAGTIGIQTSVLKHIAQFSDQKVECDRIICSAVFLCLVSASVVLGVIFLSRPFLAQILGSKGVFQSLPYILPGIWCFAINKVLTGVLNGFESMRAYALFSSLRGIGLLGGGVGAVFLGVEGYKLSIIFSISEILVLLPLGAYVFLGRIDSLTRVAEYREWYGKHVVFGLKSMSVGFITELNTRVDVLILGLFTSDAVVGVYSLASMLIEGLFQLPFVFRRIFDPKLTKLVYQQQFKALQRLIKKGVLYTLYGMVAVFGSAIFIFPFFINIVTQNPEFEKSWFVFSILSAGAVVQCAYLPFSGLLVQGGYPGYQSVLILMFCVTNILLNFLLIPLYGIYGGAWATSCSYILFILYFKWFSFKLFRIKI